MDFSKLSSNEKLAVYGAVAAIVGAFLSFGGGGSFGILTGLAMLVIIFLPQFSPSTKLPGSKGSLMLVVGGLSALGALLALLAWLPYLGLFGGVFIGLLIGIAGQLLMGWAAWQEFQSEGGKFNLGMSSGAAAPPPPQSAPPPMTPPPPPAAEPMQPPPPMAPPMSEPMEPPMSEPSSESAEGSGEMGGDKPSEGSMGGG
jgi:hypothetical protein